MTDRVNGFTVVLDKDYRDDDVEVIKQAISMIKGVVHVESNIVEYNDYMVETRVKLEIKKELIDFIQTKLK